MIRGVGCPLAAAFLRAFLCSRARLVCPGTYTAVVVDMFHDDLFTMKQVGKKQKRLFLIRLLSIFFKKKMCPCPAFMSCFQLKASQFTTVAHVSAERVTVSEYLDLLSPATQWLVQVGDAKYDDRKPNWDRNRIKSKPWQFYPACKFRVCVI